MRRFLIASAFMLAGSVAHAQETVSPVYAQKCSEAAGAMERRAGALRAVLNALRTDRESSDLGFPQPVLDLDQKIGNHTAKADIAVSALLHDYEDIAYQLRVCSR